MSRVLSEAVLELTGDGLRLEDAERLLHGQIDTLQLAPPARKKVERSRRVILDLLESGETIYGVNTGFGKLSNKRIDLHEVLSLQENLLRSHAVGMDRTYRWASPGWRSRCASRHWLKAIPASRPS